MWHVGKDGEPEHGALVPITWEDLCRWGRAIFDALAAAGDVMRGGRP